MAQYVRRHHKPEEIIRDTKSRVMTRSKLKNQTWLLCEFEPKIMKDALKNEDWIQSMNEDIEQIEKNKT